MNHDEQGPMENLLEEFYLHSENSNIGGLKGGVARTRHRDR